ncbi:uncharacterized protein [Bemisia tabaci]|uniref:uncharacterized protein isoform X2 n=1 Tax=Bemisia tabaci TaxID=7038 RepID=UPI003B288E9D
MAIQNSLIIFAKNVDSIWARTMSTRLSANINRKQNNDDEDNEDCDVGTGEEGAKQKEKAKKKKKGTFNVEEFQLLPFLNTDKNIDMELDKKENKLAKQSVSQVSRDDTPSKQQICEKQEILAAAERLFLSKYMSAETSQVIARKNCWLVVIYENKT